MTTALTPRAQVQPQRLEVDWFRTRVRHWFAKHGREFPWRVRGIGSYELVVSELLLQRTTAAAVAQFLPSFLERYPSWSHLDAAELEDLERDLKPVGLWSRRARVLKDLSSAMVAANGAFPRMREAIELLPGVGQYIANAVLLLVHGRPAPLLDGNMARVLERFFGPRRLADIRHDPYLQGLALTVVTCRDPVTTNWAILDFAARHCLARNPKCRQCDLRSRCRSASSLEKNAG